MDLFKKYGVLGKAEYESRIHIAIEKYVKQLAHRGRDHGVHGPGPDPARPRWSTSGAWRRRWPPPRRPGSKPGETAGALRDFIELVDQFRERTAEVERLAAHHEADPSRHAAQISKQLKPAMARLRETGDAIESQVAADALAAADVSGSVVLEVGGRRRSGKSER